MNSLHLIMKNIHLMKKSASRLGKVVPHNERFPQVNEN